MNHRERRAQERFRRFHGNQRAGAQARQHAEPLEAQRTGLRHYRGRYSGHDVAALVNERDGQAEPVITDCRMGGLELRGWHGETVSAFEQALDLDLQRTGRIDFVRCARWWRTAEGSPTTQRAAYSAAA